MKNKRFKAIIATFGIALTLGFSAAFGGCSDATTRDGVDGKDLNIYDIYQTTKTETDNPNLTFEDFLKEYLSFTPDEVSLKAAINQSLLSSVSIQAQFTENGSAAAYSGSGVIIDIDRASGDMTVVTNCHVVYSAKSKRYSSDSGYSDSIYVWLYGSESSVYDSVNGKTAIRATLVAASKTYDVAVLKVTDSELVRKSQARKAYWSEAEEVYLGETVYAIGNANSQKMSANVGYISRDLEPIQVDLGDTKAYTYNVLRTSAAINSGNSGGGLYNIGGEIVGLVNAKSKSDSVGFGYALTAASTRRVVRNLLDTSAANGGSSVSRVSRFVHGIDVAVADMYSTGLNESGYAEIREQVQISSVKFGSPFYGRLTSGEVLTHIKVTRGGQVIEDLDIKREHNFYDAILSVRAGDIVEITVDGKENPASVTVSSGGFENVV